MDTQHSTRVGDDRPVVVPGVPQPRSDRPALADRPDPLGRPTPRSPRRLRRAVLAGIAAGVLAVAATGGWFATRGDDDAVQVTTPPAAEPVVPAALSLDVTAPATVVAGQAATFDVTWQDGAGTFMGSTEEWGDDVGTSSLKQGPCDAATTADAPANGTFATVHTWLEPGTYTVRLGVSSYTCQDGQAVVEEAAKTLTVEVIAG